MSSKKVLTHNARGRELPIISRAVVSYHWFPRGFSFSLQKSNEKRFGTVTSNNKPEFQIPVRQFYQIDTGLTIMIFFNSKPINSRLDSPPHLPSNN
jgi:hypothetical protein